MEGKESEGIGGGIDAFTVRKSFNILRHLHQYDYFSLSPLTRVISMNENRRTFLKDSIIGTAGLTLGSMALGNCSSIPAQSNNKSQNQDIRGQKELDSSSSNEIRAREARMNDVAPMKSLLALVSYHHKNTWKVADVFSQVLDAPIKTPQQINIEELREYGLLGFGSGIYDQKHHTYLLDLADKLPQVTGRKAFIFSTSGVSRKFAIKHSIDDPHTTLREKLQAKGYIIVDEFNCTGWNTNSFLKLVGGMNKGKPNANDLKNAEEFARNLTQSFKTGNT